MQEKDLMDLDKDLEDLIKDLEVLVDKDFISKMDHLILMISMEINSINKKRKNLYLKTLMSMKLLWPQFLNSLEEKM